MKRNLILCLLTLTALVINASRSRPFVAGQVRPKTPLKVVTEPGDAGRLNFPNQAEARQIKEGRLRVSPIGAGRLPVSSPNVSPASPVYPPAVQGRVLILYDAVANHPQEKFGLAYAIMLSNLLGHFNVRVNLMPVHRYTAGSVELYQTIFYLGTHYDNAVPATFLQDIRRTNRTVVWFKNNLWQYAWNPAYDFANGYGFTFSFLKGFDSQPSPENPQPGFFDTITYKALPFVKFYYYDANTNVVYADPDLGVTQITNQNKAQVWLTANNSRTGQTVPYVVRSAQFWYFADVPFSYIGPRDRYLIFCDLLHDILRQDHKEDHRALLRLEDVSAKVEPKSFMTLVDYLYSKRIPFSVALIPTYRDAFGVNNYGVPETIELPKAANLLSAAGYAKQRGGSILMHGHTHQFDSLRNPSGVTGTDWEYWDAANNTVVAGDSEGLMSRRINAGLQAMQSQKLQPFAWETPHYQGSPSTYRAASKSFPLKYERGTYYTSDRPNLMNGDYAVPQFFPYLIGADYYGQRVLPENLGNVTYTDDSSPQVLRGLLAGKACGQNVSLSQAESLRSQRNSRQTLVGNHQALYENARYAWVVRDGYASFFFHPYLVQPQTGVPALADLQALINGIKQLGYQWKAASLLTTGN